MGDRRPSLILSSRRRVGAFVHFVDEAITIGTTPIMIDDPVALTFLERGRIFDCDPALAPSAALHVQMVSHHDATIPSGQNGVGADRALGRVLRPVAVEAGSRCIGTPDRVEQQNYLAVPKKRTPTVRERKAGRTRSDMAGNTAGLPVPGAIHLYSTIAARALDTGFNP